MTRRRRWALTAAAAASYLGLGFALWAHAWADGAGTHTLCGCGDPALFLWFFQSPATSLAHLQNPFYSTAMFHPAGINLLDQTSVMGLTVPLIPVTWLFGPVASFNLASTLVPALTALSMFVVLRRWVRWLPAAYLGGLLYGFSPFMLASLEYGHLMTAALMVLPLILAVLDEILVRQRHRARPAGVALGLLVFVQFFLSAELLAVVVVLTVFSVAVLAATAYVADRERLRVLAAPRRHGARRGGGGRRGAPGLSGPLRPHRSGPSVRCGLARHRHPRRHHPLVVGRPRAEQHPVRRRRLRGLCGTSTSLGELSRLGAPHRGGRWHRRLVPGPAALVLRPAPGRLRGLLVRPAQRARGCRPGSSPTSRWSTTSSPSASWPSVSWPPPSWRP